MAPGSWRPSSPTAARGWRPGNASAGRAWSPRSPARCSRRSCPVPGSRRSSPTARRARSRSARCSTGRWSGRSRRAGPAALVRWWSTSQVLVTCGRHFNLFVLDPATGVMTQLTSQHGRGDYGHLDARQVASGLYVQVAGACGYTYIGHQTARGTVKAVKVPHAVGNLVMVDATATDLVLAHAVSCDGGRPRGMLSLFDPVPQHETPFFTLPGTSSSAASVLRHRRGAVLMRGRLATAVGVATFLAAVLAVLVPAGSAAARPAPPAPGRGRRPSRERCWHWSTGGRARRPPRPTPRGSRWGVCPPATPPRSTRAG